MKKRLLLCAALGIGFQSPAVVITPNYAFANVYQDSSGVIYGASGVGLTDVTGTFKYDFGVAATMWMNAIMCDWNLSVTIQLANLGVGTVADAAINSFDGNGRSATGTIRFNTNAAISYFLDTTPMGNTEFNLQTSTISLGGGNVNNQRLGDATASGASNRWDMLTLSLHELEHTLGISSGSARFLDLVGPTGAETDPLRMMTVSNSLSGLASDFQIPFVPDSAHIAGSGANSNFNYTVVADPGWQKAQRALPTAVDIYALAQVNNCDMFNLNPSQVPEPATAALGLGGITVFLIARRRRLFKRDEG